LRPANEPVNKIPKLFTEGINFGEIAALGILEFGSEQSCLESEYR